jgi:hypothetical protein
MVKQDDATTGELSVRADLMARLMTWAYAKIKYPSLAAIFCKLYGHYF